MIFGNQSNKNMSSNEHILVEQNKLLLGPITLLDCSDIDTASAHWRLGRDAHVQIHKFLSKRIGDLGGIEQVASQIRRARKVQAALKVKLQIPGLSETVKAAVRLYQECLSAWTKGAGLADFHHPFLAEIVDGIPTCADDLATILQEDEVGCQTGVVREQNGSVILWHSEEDCEETPGQRFDQLRLFLFKAANGRSACAFIYPDLLPGPSFGWQASDFAQAIDTLHVRPLTFEDAILPNTLAWLSLYLGTQVSRKDLAELLGPFLGGYSLTAVYKKDGQVSVEKVEYANDKLAACALDKSAGTALFQTNVIRDLSLPIGSEEKTSPENRAWNEKRMARTARLFKVVKKSTTPLELVFRLLRSRLGGTSAYSNRDVKAYLVCQMTVEKISVWVGSGAALPGDQLFRFEG